MHFSPPSHISWLSTPQRNKDLHIYPFAFQIQKGIKQLKKKKSTCICSTPYLIVCLNIKLTLLT